jgi:hypothetical protein
MILSLIRPPMESLVGQGPGHFWESPSFFFDSTVDPKKRKGLFINPLETLV